MIRPIFRDPELDASFREFGYVVVTLMTPDVAADVLAKVQALEPADGFRPDGTGLNQQKYHCTFLDANRDYRRAVQDLVAEYVEPPACAALSDYKVGTGNVYLKPPGEGRFEIHENWAVTADPRDTTVTVWCPLVDVSVANGILNVVPKSHKILPSIPAASASKYFQSFYDELIDHWLVPVPEIRAGQAVIFDDSLLHWGERNESPGGRWAFQVVMLPDEAQMVAPIFDVDRDPPGYEYFAIEPDFWVDRDVTDLLARPGSLPYLGSNDLVNPDIDEHEFERLMRLGPETRQRVYERQPVESAYPVVRERFRCTPRPEAATFGSLGEWAVVDVEDVGSWTDAVDRIYAGTLDGMTIRGAVSADRVRTAVTRASGFVNEFKDHGAQVIFGTPLVGSSGDRSDYYENAWQINDRLQSIFEFDVVGHLGGILSTLAGGRPAVVPTEVVDGVERSYVPLTFRYLPPGGGVMHAHTANEFCNAWSAYDHLRDIARMWNSLSYFVVGERPDEGGELELYDLVWDDTPEDVASLPMCGERDELLSRYSAKLLAPAPGDMILFTGGRIWHRVTPVTGRRRRVTIGGFVGVSNDDERVYWWS